MSDSPLVLVLASEYEPQLKMLAGVPHVIATNAEEAASLAPEAQAILYWTGSLDMTRQAFLAHPHVRWVVTRNAGVDSLLFPDLVDSPIPVTNGSGVFSQSLGEFALSMMLYFAKDFPRMLRNKAAHRWEMFQVDEISIQTVGIVGYGDIGRAVAWRAHAMGMKVLALKRHAPASPDPVVQKFYGPKDLHAMLAQCDHVVVSAPLTSESRHMISDAEFAAMKPSAIVINVGRGPVIHQAALIRALEQKKIRGAGLDVFEQEPIPADDPIWDFENVFISPHTSDRTCDWLDQAMQFFLKQYARFCRAEPLENVIDKRLGY